MRINRDIWMKVLALDMLMLCFSFSVSVMGQMFESIKEIYFLNFTQASLLLSIQSIGGLVLALICILYIDALNKTKILVICGLLLCSLLMIIGAIPPLFLLFVIFILLGFSGGAINTLSNPIMMETVPSRAEKHINFMHMIFSFGSVLAPIISQMIESAYGLPGVFIILGGFALCWAVYSLFAFRSKANNKPDIEKISSKERLKEAIKVFKIQGIKQIFFISIMITSWQLSVIYYLSSYISELNQSAREGAIALSVLFLGMMISRLIYTRIADKYAPGMVLMISNFLGMLTWLGVFIVQGFLIKIIMVGLSAMFCANNFPIAFSSACKLAPKNTAAASGFVTLGYYIAMFVFIPIIGTLGDVIGLNKALVFAVIPLMIIIPAAYFLHRKMYLPNI